VFFFPLPCPLFAIVIPCSEGRDFIPNKVWKMIIAIPHNTIIKSCISKEVHIMYEFCVIQRTTLASFTNKSLNVITFTFWFITEYMLLYKHYYLFSTIANSISFRVLYVMILLYLDYVYMVKNFLSFWHSLIPNINGINVYCTAISLEGMVRCLLLNS